jgi:hypothetical protein
VKRIAWQSRLTGHRGGGTAALSDKQAEDEAAELNRRFPHLVHWTEDVPEGRTDDREPDTPEYIA